MLDSHLAVFRDFLEEVNFLLKEALDRRAEVSVLRLQRDRFLVNLVQNILAFSLLELQHISSYAQSVRKRRKRDALRAYLARIFEFNAIYGCFGDR